VVLATLGLASNQRPPLFVDPPLDPPRLGTKEVLMVLPLRRMNAHAQPEKAKQPTLPAEDEEDGPVECRTGEDILKYGPRCGIMTWQTE
jgi:hypothetical protein